MLTIVVDICKHQSACRQQKNIAQIAELHFALHEIWNGSKRWRLSNSREIGEWKQEEDTEQSRSLSFNNITSKVCTDGSSTTFRETVRSNLLRYSDSPLVRAHGIFTHLKDVRSYPAFLRYERSSTPHKMGSWFGPVKRSTEREREGGGANMLKAVGLHIWWAILWKRDPVAQ